MIQFTTLLLVTVSLAAEPVDYAQHVAPILQKHCFQCHGPEKQESGLRLDLRSSLLRGGDTGEPAILPEKGNESFLIQVISGKNPDFKMPPKGEPLTEQEQAVLRRWIDQGAQMPVPEDQELDRRKLDHWSFQPLQAVAPPPSNASFVDNEVDAFVLAKLSEKQLTPSPPASRETKIRRLFLVMHGLPPSPEEVSEFVQDDSPNAWQKLVERVLDSPRYGERWARHWLDLIHFGETHGFETNRERPNAWPFRDYVIDSFNNDKPYDQFVREQIAGDLLGAPIGTGFLVAGPYDVVKGGGNLNVVQRMNELDDMINTTGTTFLGLTLGCARCHNHKFDPVTQKDYYSMQAVFTGVKHGDALLPQTAAQREQRALLEREVAELSQKLAVFLPESERRTASPELRPAVNARLNEETFPPQVARTIRFTILKSNQYQPCIDELEIFSDKKNVALASLGAKATASGSFANNEKHRLVHINDGQYGNSRSWICDQATGWVQIELPEALPIERIVWARDRQGKFADRLAIEYRIEVADKPDDWQLVATSATRLPFTGNGAAEAKLPSYDFSQAPPEVAQQGQAWLGRLETARKLQDSLAASQQAYTGTFTQPGRTFRLYRGEPDQPREEVFPDAVSALGTLSLEASATDQQRRLALAEWITRPDNPLTARVIVNRLWQHHFGEGIVDTPSDFGHNGAKPTHPELLDWLAGELISHQWSLKHIHRRILLSNTWQQDSRPQAKGLQADASARFLWRFPLRRLEAEAIRDSMLFASGVLNLEMGGPGFSGFEVQLENVRHFFPKQSYGPEDWRRMIYMTKVRQEPESVFGAFDCPDASQVTPKRTRSTTPLQAFNLFNSRFVLQQSELLTERLEKEHPAADAARVGRAYELVFGRKATPAETTTALEFATDQGWPALCRALFNANEFVFIP